ncbi:MAG TPA: F0F1 ATP synthase subunit B [Candidatus Polarisedimenticolia bacterium]|nr:F0F1 ATP synthase subunit B [Candidatus Polarisedimenticolia bacterium]
MGTELILPQVGTIFWTLLTFVILLVLLGKFAWKPILALLDERERSVRESLESARKARAEADEMLQKNQEFLANARRETAALLEQGRKESETLRAELLAQARKESQDLVEQGKRQIQYEQKQAVEELRRQVAGLAIGAAERVIKSNLDDAAHRKLVADYLQSLPAPGPDAGRH